MSVARELRDRSAELRIAIADDSSLVFSDDYRVGWEWGFGSLLNVSVKVFDISPLRGLIGNNLGAYRSTTMRGTPKLIAGNICAWKPDLVFCHQGRAAANGMFLDRLRRAGIKTAVYLCDEPYESGETTRYSPSFDYVFSMDPDTLEAHRLSRINRTPCIYYLPPAVNTEHFKPKPYAGRHVPALFLGNASLVPRPEYLKPIERLVDGAKILFWKPPKKNTSGWIGLPEHPKLYSSCIVGLNVHRSPWMDQNCYKGRILGRSPSMQVPAGITIRRERPAEWGTGFWNEGNLPASHVNPRFLEMAACGTCVVNDDTRSELARMFPFVPRAEDPEHFYELVRYYIDHPDEAEEIGQECASLISKRHSYRHRAAEVLIRAGFKEQGADDLRSCLGEPAEYLSPQLPELRAARSSSERIGPSERWSPRSGTSSMRLSGSPSEATSIDVPHLW